MMPALAFIAFMAFIAPAFAFVAFIAFIAAALDFIAFMGLAAAFAFLAWRRTVAQDAPNLLV